MGKTVLEEFKPSRPFKRDCFIVTVPQTPAVPKFLADYRSCFHYLGLYSFFLLHLEYTIPRSILMEIREGRRGGRGRKEEGRKKGIEGGRKEGRLVEHLFLSLPLDPSKYFGLPL